jgi:hypothetical protein
MLKTPDFRRSLPLSVLGFCALVFAGWAPLSSPLPFSIRRKQPATLDEPNFRVVLPPKDLARAEHARRTRLPIAVFDEQQYAIYAIAGPACIAGVPLRLARLRHSVLWEGAWWRRNALELELLSDAAAAIGLWFLIGCCVDDALSSWRSRRFRRPRVVHVIFALLLGMPAAAVIASMACNPSDFFAESDRFFLINSLSWSILLSLMFAFRGAELIAAARRTWFARYPSP